MLGLPAAKAPHYGDFLIRAYPVGDTKVSRQHMAETGLTEAIEGMQRDEEKLIENSPP
jgi:hypothetical protein